MGYDREMPTPLSSRGKHVTVVSPCPARPSWQRLARQFKKNLIPSPMKRFSNQALERVRRFHVLNRKEIRSFAQRFIQDI
jgi:hypothetical protein